MIERVIEWSLVHRGLVLVCAVLLATVATSYAASNLTEPERPRQRLLWHVEASADDTEARLLHGLRKRCLEQLQEALSKQIATLRAPGRKKS